MSTSSRSIALVGAGYIGTHILRALLNSPNKPKVLLLVRPESSSKPLPTDLASLAVQKIPINYTDVSAVTKVLKDHSIDVVVSTLSGGGLEAQYPLADAAKASTTVKLFVPSEWGLPTEGAKAKGHSNLFAVKDGFVEYLKSIQLPYTRFYTGWFSGSFPLLVGMAVNDSVNILGKGETPFTATSETDVGGFTAHVLTTLPLDSPYLVNQTMRLEGDRVTLRDIARIYEKPIVFLAEGEQVPGESELIRQVMTELQIEAETGRGTTGYSRLTGKDEGTAGSTNKLWEGHVWDKVDMTGVIPYTSPSLAPHQRQLQVYEMYRFTL
ncbi:hypothetical protein GYMLUDRAFT_47848 [Collybiopsis luxurians FD-317 M1]|uniref:NmrA-like domain-containing protein n=1 Tax=Collybiopsis luxurians FD-317 M1 TaxID=944289 RepID=A0A0D0CBN1_9AGAR|nr:hypothetical protein GYMLUDRAFT_47848 [Collybiopsis luxurians FD-317 M1]